MLKAVTLALVAICCSFGMMLPVQAQVTVLQEVREPDGSMTPYIRFHGQTASAVELYGFFDARGKWPVSADGTTVIFTCWENPSPVVSEEMAWVRDAVEATWQKNSRIEFRGWATCAPRSSGIRIAIADEAPHAIGLGKAVDGRSRGVVINFTFSAWKEGRNCQASPAFRQSCIRFLAVHEFGHAIGFSHEQNRDDRTFDCKDLPQGPDGTVKLTPYDPASVMNYCNHDNYANGGKLSALDISALQTIYGVPTR